MTSSFAPEGVFESITVDRALGDPRIAAALDERYGPDMRQSVRSKTLPLMGNVIEIDGPGGAETNGGVDALTKVIRRYVRHEAMIEYDDPLETTMHGGQVGSDEEFGGNDVIDTLPYFVAEEPLEVVERTVLDPEESAVALDALRLVALSSNHTTTEVDRLSAINVLMHHAPGHLERAYWLAKAESEGMQVTESDWLSLQAA
jgi:hypothetical protein